MYRDNSGNEFHSYEEACHYYGCDTPAQLAAEAETGLPAADPVRHGAAALLDPVLERGRALG